MKPGDIDLNCRLQVTDIDRVDESEDTYVLAGPQNTLRYICLNTSVEPLNNVNVRKALYHANRYRADPRNHLRREELRKGNWPCAADVPRQEQ